MKTAFSWSGRSGSDPVSSRSSRQAPKCMAMMEYTACDSRIHDRNCRMRHGPQLPNLGAQTRTLMWTRSWGWEYRLFPVRLTTETGGTGRDVVGFSCGQVKRAIQGQTHDIDASCSTMHLYLESPPKAQKKSAKLFSNGVHTYYSTS